jgi:hypothetical protein
MFNFGSSLRSLILLPFPSVAVVTPSEAQGGSNTSHPKPENVETQFSHSMCPHEF